MEQDRTASEATTDPEDAQEGTGQEKAAAAKAAAADLQFKVSVILKKEI